LFILLATFAEEKLKKSNKKGSTKKKVKAKKDSAVFDYSEGAFSTPGGMSPDKSLDRY
jgi:hypothetical protein